MSDPRDAYVQKLKAQLDEWNAEIDKLAARAEKAGADKRIQYRQQLENLRAKRREIEDKLAELRDAGENAWEDLRIGLENSWEIFKASFEAAKTEFERGYAEGVKEEK